MKNTTILKVNETLLKKELEEIDSDLILFVIDSEVQKKYPTLIKNLQQHDNKRVLSFVSSNGEKSKTFEEYQNGLNFFLEKNIHRRAHLVGMGGGAVTDLSGFIASTLLRGISWSCIPTTLLGMVDAAIGGKTAINSKYGKNLIGSFHLPHKVWIDTSFLSTLSSSDYNCGIGEVIKYGMINQEIFQLITQRKDISEIIFSCANYKNYIVMNDFKELGIRQILNYGHTFGHAIEKHYQINHGESVFWGMYLIGYLFGAQRDVENLIKLNEVFNCPFTKPPWLNKTIPVQNFLEYIKKDKKKTDDKFINLVLSSDSCAEIKKYALQEIEEIFNNKIQELKKIEIKNN